MPWPALEAQLDEARDAAAARASSPSDTFNLEVLRRPVEPGQYTSKDYGQLARENGVVLSVGLKGECWDNAVAESFFATIKRELIDTRSWPTWAGLHTAVFDYIEGWYNTRRLHSSLGYRSPAEYEATIRNNRVQRVA